MYPMSLDWIIFSHPFPTAILRDNSTYKLITHPSYRKKQPKTSYIYLGKLSEKVTLSGEIFLLTPYCPGLALRLSGLSDRGIVTNTKELVYSAGAPSNFAMRLTTALLKLTSFL